MIFGDGIPEHLSLDLDERWELLHQGVDDVVSSAGGDRDAVARLLLERYTNSGHRGRLSPVTPYHLVRFATRILGQRAAVLDPACGTAGFLAECTPTAKLVCGQELEPEVADIAHARLAYRTRAAAGRSDVECANALLDDRFPTLFDGVICSPPLRVRLEPGQLPEGDARWVFDYPRTSGDAAWIQHVLAHIAPGGRAVMVLPPATLFERGVVGNVRAGLVRSGFLRAVIQLPKNTMPNTVIAPILVVLERPAEPNPQPTVLLAEPNLEGTGRRGGWPTEAGDAAADVITGWLDGVTANTELDNTEYTEVALGDLAAGDFDLTPRRHLKSADIDIAPLAEIRADLAHTADIADTEIGRLVSAISAARDLAPLESSATDRVALADLVEIRRGIPTHQLAKHGHFVVHSPFTLLDKQAPTHYLPDDAPELETDAPIFNARPGDVLVALDVRIGRVHVVTEPMFVSAAFAILRTNTHSADEFENVEHVGIDASYLGAWLRSAETQAALEHLAAGSTIRRVAMKDLNTLAIPKPDPDTQAAIGEFDHKLHTAIDAVRDLAATVDRLHQLGQQSVTAALPNTRQ